MEMSVDGDSTKPFSEGLLDASDLKLFDELENLEPEFDDLMAEAGSSPYSIGDHPPSAGPAMKSLMPEPGFCVKTKSCKPISDQKVFINILKSNEIPPPRNISEEELTTILQSDEPSSYLVPMSLGDAHMEKDKSGASCTAYDVTINVDFYRQVLESELFKTFLITISMEGLEDKYKIELNKNDWIILKNRTHMGVLSMIKIAKRIQPLITEIKSENGACSIDAGETDLAKKRSVRKMMKNPDLMTRTLAKGVACEVTVPKFILHRLPAELSQDILSAEIHLPHVDFVDIALDVGEDQIKLEALTYNRMTKYVLDLFIPILVSPELTKAKFVSCKEVLYVMMPYLKP